MLNLILYTQFVGEIVNTINKKRKLQSLKEKHCNYLDNITFINEVRAKQRATISNSMLIQMDVLLSQFLLLFLLLGETPRFLFDLIQ